MRPTGRMHVGNYFGALANWVRLQNEVASDVATGYSPLTRHSRLPLYECFYFIADWHSLTSDYADTSEIAQNVIEIATDYLAGGLDPDKSVLFLQSLVPEHAELHLLLSMVTPLGWLERVPTYKEALENIKDKDLHNYGFLGYPVLQCGDIVMYGEPGVPLCVPVGEDQVSHVEVSREIVRRFDVLYGLDVIGELFEKRNEASLLNCLHGRVFWGPATKLEYPLRESMRTYLVGKLRTTATEEGVENFIKRVGNASAFFKRVDVLTEPQVMLTKTPRVPGLDGRKMSKSYGNTITLSESDADIRAKTKVMVTDPARKRRSDPGNPDVCPVYDWHKLFAPRDAHGALTEEGKATLKWSAEGCRTAGIGCIECKAAMADNLIKWITPIRERRVEYDKNTKQVLRVIDEGSQKARSIAVKTMERVREAVFGWEKKRDEIASGGTGAKE